MTETVLTYTGTVLIAMEFIRKFSALQALVGMLIGWPVALFLGEIVEKGFENWYETYFKAHKLNVIFRTIVVLILCLASLPLTLALSLIWFIILLLNSFHNWVNRLYSEGKRRYHPMFMFIIGLTLFAHKQSDFKKYAAIDEEMVMQKIEETDIPILPIIGVILISVALVLFII